jgi:carbonic anhydrase
MPATTSVSHTQALDLLKAGNARYASHARQADPHTTNYAAQERPIAIIVGCCDHRVPPDTLFDVDPGKLFAVRVAGNVVTPTQLGSIEYGVMTYAPHLIVVLGHQHCSAVNDAIDTHIHGQPPSSEHTRAITDEIAPACDCCARLLDTASGDEIAFAVTHRNIANSIERLRAESQIIRSGIEQGEIEIVGAYYNMDAGTVQFLDH